MMFRRQHAHSHNDPPAHSHEHSHSHTHGTIDPGILDTRQGIAAIKWSLLVLLVTALLQLAVVFVSRSTALLADAIHNLTDCATAFPLWIAFTLARWKPTKRFTYGYGRVEDLAGLVIVLMIASSAIGAAYIAIDRLFHPQTVGLIWAVMAASVIGFLGNEAVARIRIKVGRKIGSAALIADGLHARTDGFTSLSVLIGAAGVWLGYPLADPIIGLFISILISRVVWQSSKAVFLRLLDGVDPQVMEEIREAACETPGVAEVTETRVRWIGHRLHAELNVAVNPDLSIEQAHEIAKEVRHTLLHQLQYLSNATIHLDPLTASGETHHCIREHAHDELPTHSH
jgi:cation diffusion facilitator family transporter